MRSNCYVNVDPVDAPRMRPAYGVIVCDRLRALITMRFARARQRAQPINLSVLQDDMRRDTDTQSHVHGRLFVCSFPLRAAAARVRIFGVHIHMFVFCACVPPHCARAANTIAPHNRRLYACACVCMSKVPHHTHTHIEPVREYSEHMFRAHMLRWQQPSAPSIRTQPHHSSRLFSRMCVCVCFNKSTCSSTLSLDDSPRRIEQGTDRPVQSYFRERGRRQTIA